MRLVEDTFTSLFAVVILDEGIATESRPSEFGSEKLLGLKYFNSNMMMTVMLIQ